MAENMRVALHKVPSYHHRYGSDSRMGKQWILQRTQVSF